MYLQLKITLALKERCQLRVSSTPRHTKDIKIEPIAAKSGT